jgi:DNA-binding MarR family transcriptional regulator
MEMDEAAMAATFGRAAFRTGYAVGLPLRTFSRAAAVKRPRTAAPAAAAAGFRRPDILNAMRNVTAGRSNTDDGGSNPAGRSALERELLEEMTAWSPRDRGGAFKTWHRHALSLVHLTVLTAIEAEGPLAMKRLAELMDVSDASATGIVDRMEKRGLVERRHGTADRRVVLVYPTDAGTKVFSEMAAHRRGMLSRVLAELSEEEMEALLVGMRAIHAARRRLLAAHSDARTATDPEPPPTG